MEGGLTAEALLLGTILIGTEYGLKQWVEELPTLRTHVARKTYWRYRAVQAAIVTGLLYAFYQFTPWLSAVALMATAAASLEMPLCSLQARLLIITGARCRWLQILPMIGVAAVALFTPLFLDLAPSAITNSVWAWISWLSAGWEVTPLSLVRYVAAFTFLAQPTNYLIRWLVDKDADSLLVERIIRRGHALSVLVFREQTAAANENVVGESQGAHTLRIGRVIGLLERWLLLTLVLHSEFGLMGLVLTAKSLARFKQMEDAAFAEYYLLGTLYSTLSAVLVGLALLPR